MIKFLKFLTFILVCHLILFPQLILSTEFKVGDNIVIPESTFILDDYFIAGNNIKFSGIVEGDLISGCQTLTSKGTVEGNLMAAAKELDISGEVGGSFRGFAQNISLDGKLKRNFLGFAQSINLKEGSEIGGDIIAYCNELKISGKIGKGVRTGACCVVISGIINGDVFAKADEITIMPDAKIYGNLNYKSKKEAKIERGAEITGETNWTKIVSKEGKKGLCWAKLLIKFLFFCASLVTGFFMLLVAKKEVKAAKDAVFKDFLKNLGLGFVFVICIPIAAIILLFTVLGIPISIIAIFAYLILFYIAKIFVGFALGEKVLQLFKTNGVPAPAWSLMVGLLLIYILFLIPYLHWIVYLLTLFVGFGSVFQAKKYLVPPPTTT